MPCNTHSTASSLVAEPKGHVKKRAHACATDAATTRRRCCCCSKLFVFFIDSRIEPPCVENVARACTWVAGENPPRQGEGRSAVSRCHPLPKSHFLPPLRRLTPVSVCALQRSCSATARTDGLCTL